MKKLLIFLFALIVIPCIAQNETKPSEWKLLWEEEFNGTSLDESVWSRTDRGKADWENTQSKRDDLLEVKDGVLILKGIVNPNPVTPDKLVDGKITVEADTAHYLTAGIVSQGKHAFPAEGRIEIRAKLQGAKGAWPAIWLLPFNKEDSWPIGGEIDICERLNFDDIAYQTVHTHYTLDLGKDANPPHSGIGKINPDDFNVYAIEFCQDSLILYINGNKTFSYPRLKNEEAASQGQFPFIKPWYLLIDMQLGGNWVGRVDPQDLPIQMEIDWVRQYIKEDLEQPHFQPINPNATPEAQALLKRLYATVDNGNIISGLHHNVLKKPYYFNDLDRINEASGKEPMIWGGDVAWDAKKVVDMATEQYNSGHIITLMWHAGRPFDKGYVDFKHQTQGKFSDKQWKELVTEGTEMHRLWIAQVDSISEYLKTLQERHIPVIWRPLHEMNGEWFWWGNRPGKDGYQKLWRMLYDRMTNYHHLNNLIWVWNANAVRETPGDRAMKLDDYFPGIDCVDVLATDVYHRDWRQCHHDDLAKLAQGKLIALGELGSLPTPQILKNMPKFAWFMMWTGFSKDEFNTLDELNAIFSLPNVINYNGK